MNYGKAQSDLKAKYPPSNSYHKYSFSGVIRTYKNKLTLPGENVIYLGITKTYIDHWDVPLRAVKSKGRIEKVISDNRYIPDNFKPTARVLSTEEAVNRFRELDNQAKLYKEDGPPIINNEIVKRKVKSSVADKPTIILAVPFRRTYIKEGLLFKCCYCEIKLDKDNYTRDHLLPISKGGSNNQDNLRPCCKQCNMEKSGLLLHSYIQLLNLKLLDYVDDLRIGKLQTKIRNANEIAKQIAR